MSTILEAKAIISAEDRTGAAFAAIENKINHLSRIAKEVGNVSGSVRQMTQGFGNAGREVGRMNQNVSRLSRTMHTMGALSGGAAMIAAPIAAYKAKQFAHAVKETYREFDKERRFGKAVMGLSDAEQAPLVQQAIHMGGSTKFNDIQVLEAQRELAARGLNKEQVLGMMQAAADLGQALDLKLPDAVRQMEGALFGFRKDVSTQEAALKSSRETADMQVKAAKISGMKPEDLTQVYKYGASPFRMAGLSEAQLLAFGGLGKKANMGGDEMGTAARALAANLMKPTAGARTALMAAGINYSSYQTMGAKPMDAEAFSQSVAQTYGVALDKGAKAALQKVFNDKAIVADAGKFQPKIMTILSDVLGGDDAKSKKSIAGEARRYRDASIAGVDSQRLFVDIMRAMANSPGLANSIFGAKQGGRIMSAIGDPDLFQHKLDDIEHSKGYAEKVSSGRMEGFDGAVSRFEGAIKNLETALGRSLDPQLTSGTNFLGQITQAFAELDPKVHLAAAAFGAAAIAIVGFETAVKTVAALNGAAGIAPGVVGGLAASSGARLAMLSRLGVYGAAAYAGAMLGEGALAVGRVANGKHWTPRDADAMNDAGERAQELEGRIAQARASSRNADALAVVLLPMQQQLATLRGQIAEGYNASGMNRAAPGLAAFGFGPAGTRPGGGVVPERPQLGSIDPAKIDVTGKVQLEGSAQVSVNVSIGASSNLLEIVNKAQTVASQGHVKASVGTSMPEAAPGASTGKTD